MTAQCILDGVKAVFRPLPNLFLKKKKYFFRGLNQTFLIEKISQPIWLLYIDHLSKKINACNEMKRKTRTKNLIKNIHFHLPDNSAIHNVVLYNVIANIRNVARLYIDDDEIFRAGDKKIWADFVGIGFCLRRICVGPAQLRTLLSISS